MDHEQLDGPPALRASLAYGFVVTLFIAPFLVFATAVASDYAVSATVVVIGIGAATWACCSWLLHSGRGAWLLAIFLAAVAAVVVVLVTA